MAAAVVEFVGVLPFLGLIFSAGIIFQQHKSNKGAIAEIKKLAESLQEMEVKLAKIETLIKLKIENHV